MAVDRIADITYQDQTFPPGTAPVTVYVFQLINASGAVLSEQLDQAPGEATVTFSIDAAGTYRVRGFQRDAAGNTIGAVVTSSPFVQSGETIREINTITMRAA